MCNMQKDFFQNPPEQVEKVFSRKYFKASLRLSWGRDANHHKQLLMLHLIHCKMSNILIQEWKYWVVSHHICCLLELSTVCASLATEILSAGIINHQLFGGHPAILQNTRFHWKLWLLFILFLGVWLREDYSWINCNPNPPTMKMGSLTPWWC